MLTSVGAPVIKAMFPDLAAGIDSVGDRRRAALPILDGRPGYTEFGGGLFLSQAVPLTPDENSDGFIACQKV